MAQLHPTNIKLVSMLLLDVVTYITATTTFISVELLVQAGNLIQ